MDDQSPSQQMVSKGRTVGRPIGAIVIFQPIVPKRRRCLTVLAAGLFVALIAMLNMLYVLAKNFIQVRDLHAQQSGTVDHLVAAWPSGYFPPNTYGFHPVNEHAVSSHWARLLYRNTGEMEFK